MMSMIQMKELKGKKRCSWLMIVLMAVLILSSCSPAPMTEQGEPLRRVTLVLDWVPNTNHTGFYVADKLGYYAEEGLEVDIVQPSQGGSADLVAAGQGEFGISYQEQVTYARTAADPLPVKAVAAIIQHNTSGFASPVEKGIERPRDFEGKRYGGWGSPVEEAMLQMLMNQDGGDFQTLQMINVGTSDFFDAVENHVDFTWIYYGWDGVAAELRDYPINFILLQNFSDALNFYTPVLITGKRLISEEPELVTAFVQATSRGYRYAIENPEEAADLLLQEVPELEREMVVASQRYLADQYQADASRWGEMKLEVWENYANWMFEQNLLDKPLDATAAFTNDFLPNH